MTATQSSCVTESGLLCLKFNITGCGFPGLPVHSSLTPRCHPLLCPPLHQREPSAVRAPCLFLWPLSQLRPSPAPRWRTARCGEARAWLCPAGSWHLHMGSGEMMKVVEH